MAFPGTYNINYYKGDTLEFRIYPKTADGEAFNLSPYTGISLGDWDNNPSTPNTYPQGGTYDNDNNPSTPNVPYDSVMFVFADSRGSSNWHRCLGWISENKDYVQCVIRPDDAQYLDAGSTYVYDVQVSRNPDTNLPEYYPVVHTLLTGTITVTGQVTP